MSENINDDMSSKPHYEKPLANENIIQTDSDGSIANGMYQPSPSFPTPQSSQTALSQSSYPVPTQILHPVPTQTQQAVFPPCHPSVIYDVGQARSIKTTETKVLGNHGYMGIAGIPLGIVIIANGIIGIFSSRNPNNGCLNGTNMAFSVVSCFVAVGNIFCFSIALILMLDCSESYVDDEWRRCTEKSTGVALAVLLLLVYVVEFFVALVGSINTCFFCECCKQCCRETSQEVRSYPEYAYPYGFGTAPSMLPTYQQQQQHFGYNENNDHTAANPYVNQGYNTETMSSNDLQPSYDDHSMLI